MNARSQRLESAGRDGVIPARWARWAASLYGTARTFAARSDVTLKEKRKLILVPRENR